ncbi:hypothetical protein DFR58_13639 [Anaerobacterium chartisolvens]|uniref:Uncharacterized protein n=1 Tax=Anaerobacterium chartisolvens TaxID=1297424 RepID=A0A369AJU1_9FIRM|nr:hypothetical protein DFR58_13639 [Anaerobacterium chartisolvens]
MVRHVYVCSEGSSSINIFKKAGVSPYFLK